MPKTTKDFFQAVEEKSQTNWMLQLQASESGAIFPGMETLFVFV